MGLPTISSPGFFFKLEDETFPKASLFFCCIDGFLESQGILPHHLDL